MKYGEGSENDLKAPFKAVSLLCLEWMVQTISHTDVKACASLLYGGGRCCFSPAIRTPAATRLGSLGQQCITVLLFRFCIAVDHELPASSCHKESIPVEEARVVFNDGRSLASPDSGLAC